MDAMESGGIWGGIATGILHRNPLTVLQNGMVWCLEITAFSWHSWKEFLITIVIAVVGTLLCVAVVRIFTPLRVSLKEEQLDWM